MNLKAVPAMLAMIPAAVRGVGLEDMAQIKKIVRAAFPTVNQISTNTLMDWLAAEPAPLLIDVRKPEEFVVSHLRGAVNAPESDVLADLIQSRQPDRTVLYCAVGYRSAQLAEQLQKRGMKNVFNLEGSIFQWANEGRDLFCGEQVVHHVHPYNSKWAGLLKPGLAV